MKTFLLILLLASSSWAKEITPVCVAHRANGYGALENSLQAFKRAEVHGAIAVEFDILHTKDGATLVYHDDKTGRVTTGEKCPKGVPINQLTLAEMNEFCTLTNGERLPGLKEVLDIFSETKTQLFIEFKEKFVLDKDIQLIKELYKGRLNQIIFISFHPAPLKKIEELKMKDRELRAVKTLQLKKYGHAYFPKDLGGIDAKHINRVSIWLLHQAKKEVGVYTKDSSDEIKKYVDIGVDYITTNDPELCQSSL